MSNRRLLAAALTIAVTLFGATPPPPSPADALYAHGDFAGATVAYEQAAAATPGDLASVLGAARMEAYNDRLDLAARYAHAALAIDPANARAKHLLAAIEERQRIGTSDFVIEHAPPEVDLPFLQTDPLPVIAATIDGHPVKLLLDTGAPGLEISAAFAAKARIATKVAGEGVFAGGQRAQIREGHADTLTLGSARLRNIPVGVLPSPPGVDGILGTSVFYTFLTTFDYARGRLVLRPKSASTRFERDAAAAGAAIIPMYLVPDHFIFANGSIDRGAPALFNIDTGGGGIGVQLTKASLDAAHIAPDTAHATSFGGGGGENEVLPFTATVSLGTATVEKVPGVYFPGGDQYGIFPFAVAGTITHLFFRKTALTFDFAAMKLIVGGV